MTPTAQKRIQVALGVLALLLLGTTGTLVCYDQTQTYLVCCEPGLTLRVDGFAQSLDENGCVGLKGLFPKRLEVTAKERRASFWLEPSFQDESPSVFIKQDLSFKTYGVERFRRTSTEAR